MHPIAGDQREKIVVLITFSFLLAMILPAIYKNLFLNSYFLSLVETCSEMKFTFKLIFLIFFDQIVILYDDDVYASI